MTIILSYLGRTLYIKRTIIKIPLSIAIFIYPFVCIALLLVQYRWYYYEVGGYIVINSHSGGGYHTTATPIYPKIFIFNTHKYPPHKYTDNQSYGGTY